MSDSGQQITTVGINNDLSPHDMGLMKSAHFILSTSRIQTVTGGLDDLRLRRPCFFKKNVLYINAFKSVADCVCMPAYNLVVLRSIFFMLRGAFVFASLQNCISLYIFSRKDDSLSTMILLELDQVLQWH